MGKKIIGTRVMRVNRDLAKLINFVRANYIMAGKTPPRISDITKVISNKVDKEELLRDVLIQF